MTLRISIVMPSFNHAAFLPQALDSLLGQGYPDLEILVMDGASTDGTCAVLERYAQRYSELQWLSEPDAGPADAVNKGLARVSGDVVGIQSADDVCYLHALQRVADAFEQHQECGFLYGDVDGIDLDGCIVYQRKMPDFSWAAVFGLSLCLPQGSIYFRQNLIENVGGWNGTIYGCDLDYWMRLMLHTQSLHLPFVLSGWRRYPEQRTRPDQSARIWRDYWRMIEESELIATAPRGIQRLARASKHLLALRFPPQSSRWVVWKHMLIGGLLHPGFWRYNPWQMLLTALLPGMQFVRQTLRQRKGRRTEAGETRLAPVSQLDHQEWS